MLNEIDISLVPLTPRGVNHDFKAVKEYDFVRFDKKVAWKTLTLIGPETDVSDCEDIPNTVVNSEENLSDLHQSPMIEFRKKRITPITNKKMFNPINKEVMDTSIGWHTNYEKSKRKTIAVISRMSTEPQTDKLRKSLPTMLLGTVKENIHPNFEQNKHIVNKELELLRASISESRPLITTEHDRLSTTIADWRHILQNEDDVPPEAQGRIQSTVGRTQILLDKRFNSTLVVLDKADNYAYNDGAIIDDGDKEYKPGDVYGFVDLLINEIKKLDKEFQSLLELRDNAWVEVPKEAVVVKKRIVNVARNKKTVKSKLDLNSLRKQFAKITNEVDSSSLVTVTVSDQEIQRKSGEQSPAPLSLSSDPANEHNVSLGSEAGSMNESGRSLRTSVRKTVRSNCVIKSTTGTPVHSDTPRPRRVTRRSAAPQSPMEMPPPAQSSPSSSAAKRPYVQTMDPDDDRFVLPKSQPKKARQSKL